VSRTPGLRYRRKLRAAEAATPPAPPPANPFDNYESISTPEGMVWNEGERWPTWTLPRWAVLDHRRHSPRPTYEH
jgi:hypothetical protein